MPVLAWGVSLTFILLVPQFSEKFLLPHSSCSTGGFKSFCYTPGASFSSVRNFPYTPEASFNEVFHFYSSCSVGLVVSRVFLTLLQFSWQFQCGRVSLTLLISSSNFEEEFHLHSSCSVILAWNFLLHPSCSVVFLVRIFSYTPNAD